MKLCLPYIFIPEKEYQAKLRKYAGLMKGYLLYGLTVKLDYYEAKSETLNDQIKINDSDKYGEKNPQHTAM